MQELIFTHHPVTMRGNDGKHGSLINLLLLRCVMIEELVISRTVLATAAFLSTVRPKSPGNRALSLALKAHLRQYFQIISYCGYKESLIVSRRIFCLIYIVVSRLPT